MLHTLKTQVTNAGDYARPIPYILDLPKTSDDLANGGLPIYRVVL